MNITAIQTKSTTYENLETLIQEVVQDFAFEEGAYYKIQIFGKGKICVKGETPTDAEGFEYYAPIEYQHASGSAVYVKAIGQSDNNNIVVNIAKG